MKKDKWYEVKLLFMEKKSNDLKGLRFYILLKANNIKDAKKRARKIGETMPYPYKRNSEIRFEFLGLEHIFQCYSSPEDGSMLSVYKDEGKTWEEAVQYIRPLSQYEVETFCYSSVGLYLVNFVYFVKNSKTNKLGKITTCQILIKSHRKNNLLLKAYKIAIDKKVLADVLRIRKDSKKNSVAEFVGIEEIVPVFNRIKDGMELNRTIDHFNNKNELLKLVL